MVNNIIEGLHLTLRAVIENLSNNSVAEIKAFITLFIFSSIVIAAQKKIRQALDTHDFAKERYFLLLIDITAPVILLSTVAYMSPLILTGAFSIILYKTFALLYLGYFFITNLTRLDSFKDIPWGLLLYVLLILGVFSRFILDINTSFSKNPAVQELFLIGLKISLILIFYLFFLRASRYFSSFISDKRDLTRRIIDNLIPFVSVLFLGVSVLWLLQIVNLTSGIFTGFVLCVIIILLYAFLRAYCTSKLAGELFYHRDSYQELLEKIRLLLKLLLIYGLFHIFVAFFNFSYIVNYLDSVYLLKTDLVKISFFSAISSVFLFLVLFSLIGIFKNLAFLSYTKGGREVEAGSMRAIISNLGLLFILIISLSKLGLNWKVLIPFAGALGIGIGFGLQTVMNNYISGFILLFSKKLKVGDVIEIQGNAGRAIGNHMETIYGRVQSIDVLSTVVRTTDNIEIVIPNSQFIEGQIVNFSLSDSDIRLRIPFGVSYASDPNQIKELLLKVCKDHPQILNTPEPNVLFSEMADSALVFNLLCWINIRMLWRINPLISEIYFKGWYELKEAGVEIPFPQRDVWFKNKVKVEIEK